MRVIEKTITVRASPGEVWNAWTTNDGVRSFFAPDADIELAVGGKYEIFFNHALAYGDRGSEGCTILEYAPQQLLSFTWNAPPAIPALRAAGAKTNVTIRFASDAANTRVRLEHVVEQEGEDWDRYYEYFNRAWEVVLGRLGSLFTSGPIDWNR